MAMLAPQNLKEIIESQRPGYSLDQCFYKDPNIFQLDLEYV